MKLTLIATLSLLLGMAVDQKASTLQNFVVTVPGAPPIHVRATDRMAALFTALRPTVWTEQEFKSAQTLICSDKSLSPRMRSLAECGVK